VTRPRRRPTLIDPRLAARVSITRRYLVVAGALGIAATVALVVQAVLIANIIDRSLLHGATIGAVTPQLVGLAGAFVARAACASAAELAAARTSLAVTSTLRRALLRQTLDLGPVWLSGERAGELSATATRGIAALDVYFGRYLPQAVLAVLAPVGILVWVGWEDPVSLLILLGLLALVPPTMIHFGAPQQSRPPAMAQPRVPLLPHARADPGAPHAAGVRPERPGPPRDRRRQREPARRHDAHTARRVLVGAVDGVPRRDGDGSRGHGPRFPPPERDRRTEHRTGRAAGLP